MHDVALRFDQADQRFELDFAQLEATMTRLHSLRLVILNSPSNPTGWVISQPQLQKLFELCDQQKITLLSDEMYDRIVFTDGLPPSASDMWHAGLRQRKMCKDVSIRRRVKAQLTRVAEFR